MPAGRGGREEGGVGSPLLPVQQPIYQYVYRLWGRQERPGLHQDTFLKAYRALAKTLQGGVPRGAWLYRIATNVCLDELRHRKLVKWQPWEAFVSVFHPSQVAKDNPERDARPGGHRGGGGGPGSPAPQATALCLILREYHDLVLRRDRAGPGHDPHGGEVAPVPRPGVVPLPLREDAPQAGL